MTKSVKSKSALLRLNGFEFAEKSIQNFTPGCRMIGLTRGQFSLIDLITAILKKTGPAKIICCTWSAGLKDVNQVKKLINDKNIQSFTIVTDHSYVTRQAKYAVTMEEAFGKENIRTTEIHAKFTLIQNENYNICIRTSMNLNANKTCENFEIDDDKEIYSFYESFISSIINQMPIGFEKRSAVVERVLDKVFKQSEHAFLW